MGAANGPSRKIPSRLIHGLVFAAMSIGFVVVVNVLPELWKGSVTRFATIGGFLTAYGVMFAVIETWRARAASELAYDASRDARAEISALYDVKDTAECQTCIRNVLQDLDKGGWASTAALTRILELYTAQFYMTYAEPNSKHRTLIASLQSHAADLNGPLNIGTRSRLRNTLINMLTDITADSSAKISERKK